MRILENPERSDWSSLTKRPVADLKEIRDAVGQVLADVRNGGDTALREYTLRFDKVVIDEIRIGEDAIELAAGQLDAGLKAAITAARQNISKFHRAQADTMAPVETSTGITCWRRSLPIDSIGLYIPGGTAPLFSTVLMLAEPARLAGCRKIVLCTPPGAHGAVHPAVLYAAQLCGVSDIYRVGGAQAIAAMAYGTASVPRVNKIFGPGNQYVTAAKQIVQQEGTAIDMPAGPSEVVVIADGHCDPAAVASDLIAQAEHGIDSQALCLTDSRHTADKVSRAVASQLAELPRRSIAEQAIENSFIIVFDDLKTAMAFSNDYAPEHLIINADNYRELAGWVRTAGSVFLGPWTPESLGDYASGTNHTLPTNGYARSYSGVSLDSFVKKVTFQEASREGLEHIAATVTTMAGHEELAGHQRAVTIRLDERT
jgi:histidinol dehydrogenase